MKKGDFIRTLDGIKKIEKYEYEPEIENCHHIWFEKENYGIMFTDNEIIKSSQHIEDLICVGDLIFIDVEPEYRPDYYEGIIVPRVIETLEEGEDYYMKIKYGKYVLRGIITKEQIENGVYWL